MNILNLPRQGIYHRFINIYPVHLCFDALKHKNLDFNVPKGFDAESTQPEYEYIAIVYSIEDTFYKHTEIIKKINYYDQIIEIIVSCLQDLEEIFEDINEKYESAKY